MSEEIKTEIRMIERVIRTVFVFSFGYSIKERRYFYTYTFKLLSLYS